MRGILVADKKIMEKIETEKTEGSDSGWKTLLLETIVRSVQSFADGTVRSIHETVHAFTFRLARQVFLLLLSFVGIVFLLVGCTKLLGAMYPLPGAGEMIVGAFVLLAALVVYAFRRDSRS